MAKTHHTLDRLGQLNNKIHEQEHTIMRLKDTISHLHVENAFIKQRLGYQQDKEFDQHLRLLSSTILNYYNNKFGRNTIQNKLLSVGEMIQYLEEIFQNADQGRSKSPDHKKRSLSPAFTFANLEQVEEPVFELNLKSIDNTPTTESENNSQKGSHREAVDKLTEFKSPKPRQRKKESNTKSGFFSFFKGKSDNKIQFK